jgi:tRNA uridine 5-carbamoylmethylation protein Kti12
MKPCLIAMVGLPRSGKSTIAREWAARDGAPIVNRDAIRLALHGKRYEAAAEPMVKAVSLYMIKALFGAGHQTVFYDETNFSYAARDFITSPDWLTYFWCVYTHPDECIRRAHATGQPDLESVIREMMTRYQPLRPHEKEGWFAGDTEGIKLFRSLNEAN